jgi:hypothetical protein
LQQRLPALLERHPEITWHRAIHLISDSEAPPDNDDGDDEGDDDEEVA